MTQRSTDFVVFPHNNKLEVLLSSSCSSLSLTFCSCGDTGVGLCTTAPSALKNLYGCPGKLLWENLGGVAETKMPTCKVKDCKLNEMTTIRAQ